MLAGQYALRHLNIERAFSRCQPAVGIDFRDTQGELPGAAVQCGLEIEQHLRMMVFAASRTERAAVASRTLPPLRAEQRLEEVAEGRVAPARTTEFEAGIPVRRRAKILARRMPLSQLIVGGALLGTLENLIGFADVLEACFGVLFLADVRMIFASELAIGLLDLRLGGIARHTHDLVVVLVLHRTRKPSNGEAGKDTMRRARRINNPV